MPSTEIGMSLAFLAGVASFFSPCVFALVPAYVGYLAGRSVSSSGDGRDNRWLTFAHGVAFVLGFSTVFISLGLAASAIGGLLYNLRDWLEIVGGVVVVIFGLHMLGVLHLRFLDYDLRPQGQPNRTRGLFASYLMGIFFSAGWSPCVGPILGAILTIALNGGNISQGIVLLAAYSAGLAIPFLFAATQISLVSQLVRKYSRVTVIVEKVMGVVLVILGVMLFTGLFQKTFSSLASFYGIYDELVLGRTVLIVMAVLAVLGLLPAYIASRKGRRFIDWWLFGFGLFPIALPMAFMLKPKSSAETQVETQV